MTRPTRGFDPFAITRPHERLMTHYVIVAVLTTVAFPITLPLLYIKYRTLRYRFEGRPAREMLLIALAQALAQLCEPPPEPIGRGPAIWQQLFFYKRAERGINLQAVAQDPGISHRLRNLES